MPRHVDDIVDGAFGPNIPILVSLRAITSVEYTQVRVHVRIRVPFVVSPNPPGDRGPRVFENEKFISGEGVYD